MKYWLMKSEPDVWSIDQQKQVGNLERAQLRACQNRKAELVDPDTPNRTHCKLQVVRTRQIPARQKRMAGTMDLDTTSRFHCKLHVATTLTPIDPQPGRLVRTIFGRRGPRGVPNFAR